MDGYAPLSPVLRLSSTQSVWEMSTGATNVFTRTSSGPVPSGSDSRVEGGDRGVAGSAASSRSRGRQLTHLALLLPLLLQQVKCGPFRYRDRWLCVGTAGGYINVCLYVFVCLCVCVFP
eukprot:GHVU01056288.1.p1 GENE.GHVU01056288.1~~GHVU01056288.1.p1  ORF type:complete len:119 (+),score=4.00 GHVU01056288.1:39-395(+)